MYSGRVTKFFSNLIVKQHDVITGTQKFKTIKMTQKR